MKSISKTNLNFLSKKEMREIKGAAMAWAECLDGTTISCSGNSCWSGDQSENHSGVCFCYTSSGIPDAKTCS